MALRVGVRRIGGYLTRRVEQRATRPIGGAFTGA